MSVFAFLGLSVLCHMLSGLLFTCVDDPRFTPTKQNYAAKIGLAFACLAMVSAYCAGLS